MVSYIYTLIFCNLELVLQQAKNFIAEITVCMIDNIIIARR